MSTFALCRLIEPERRASLLDPLTKAFGNFSFTAKSVGDLVKSHEEPAFGNIKTESSDRGWISLNISPFLAGKFKYKIFYYRSQDDLALLKPKGIFGGNYGKIHRASISSEILNKMSRHQPAFNFTPNWQLTTAPNLDQGTPHFKWQLNKKIAKIAFSPFLQRTY